MNNIKISVIIPVYNVEKYIDQCIESVLIQTYKNIEVVLIDDGSPDNCGKILDEYALKDTRIIVIHNSNGGLSSARNTGIKVATGDYLTFLDSDDYWDDKTAIESLVNQLGEFKSDVISWGYKKFYEEKMIFKEVAMGLKHTTVMNLNKEDALISMIKHNCYIASAWNKLVNRELFEKNDLFFIKDIFSEDIDWCARLAVHANSFDILNNNFYVYRQRDGSITKTINENNIINLENILATCLNFLPSDSSSLMQKSYNAFVAVQYANYLICLNYIKGSECFEKHLQVAQYYQFLLGYGFSMRVRAINLCSKLVGLRYTILLLGYALKFK